MNSKRFSAQYLILLLCFLFLFPGVSLAKTKLKLGHAGALNHPYHTGSLMFKDLVAEKSMGTSKLCFPRESTGQAKAVGEGAHLVLSTWF